MVSLITEEQEEDMVMKMRYSNIKMIEQEEVQNKYSQWPLLFKLIYLMIKKKQLTLQCIII